MGVHGSSDTSFIKDELFIVSVPAIGGRVAIFERDLAPHLVLAVAVPIAVAVLASFVAVSASSIATACTATTAPTIAIATASSTATTRRHVGR